MQLIIGADFVSTKTNEQLFINADANGLFGEALHELLVNADYRVFNLEMPLTDRATPIKKCGPNLIGITKTISLYKSMKIDMFCLANSHYGLS